MKYKKEERIFKALANYRRLAILRFLNNTKKAKVGDIAREINLSFKATSKHLQILKNVEMVFSEQVSLEQFYYLNKFNFYLKRNISIL